MVRIQNLTKSFGPRVLFQNINVSINPGERLGLVGRNGHGKTTLMKIIAGTEHAESGTVEMPREYTLGYVTQHISFSAPTVLAEACGGREYPEDELWQVEKILFGLGFSADDLTQPPERFSGGFQVRINLAKVLVAKPSLLLLDEPTNYLDIGSIRWLEGFLREWEGELLLVTHDRSFMDAVVTHTAAIHRGNLRKVEGNTEKLYEQIAKEEEIYEKTRQNDEKRRKEVELFVRRFRAKARLAGMVQSRVKMLEKMDRKDRLASIENLDFSFAEAPQPSKLCMTVENIRFGYEAARPLFENLSFAVGRGDRICIIGKNGRGKSTLLRLLAGELEPQAGGVTRHPSLQQGYFAQTNIRSLNENRSVEEEIASVINNTDRQKARNIAGAMMFESDEAEKKIAVLSGGEKARVMLGKIIMKPANLLLLDEPTNHLDMQSADSLLEAIDSFEGAVIIVTHNELFLHALATRLVVFGRGGVMVHEGDYRSFLDKYGWEDDTDRGPKKTGARKDLRRARSEVITRRSKVLGPLQKRLAAIEKRIEDGEADIIRMDEEIIAASSAGDGKTIAELGRRRAERNDDVHAAYEEFDALASEVDRVTREFETELQSLSGEQDETD